MTREAETGPCGHSQRHQEPGGARETLPGRSPSRAVGVHVCCLSHPLETLVATLEKMRLGLSEMGAQGSSTL